MARYLIIFLFIGLCAAQDVEAQQNRIIPVDDWTYQYIKRLQRRGHLPALHPTSLPYKQGEVAAALKEIDRTELDDRAAQWVDLLERELGIEATDDRRMQVGVSLEGGFRSANTKRFDMMRPVDQTVFYPNGMLRLYMESESVIADWGVRHELFYTRDPDGIDAARRLFTRNEHSYVGYRSRLVSVYLGRFANHWGPSGEAAVLLSSNPRTYDQLRFRFGTRRFALRSMIGELDSSSEDGVFDGRGGDRASGQQDVSVRRYLSTHRFDWRPSPRFAFSLMEAVLFSGKNTGFSLKYLNPLTFFYLSTDNQPKNDENNALMAGMLWAQFSTWTLSGQLMVDDFDFLDGKEPASIALSGSIHYAGFRQADLGIELTLVSNRAYNTEQAEGRYVYLLRGIATQFNDFIHTQLFTDLYLDTLLPGLIVTPGLQILWQGEFPHIDRPYPDDDVDFILAGTSLRTLRTGLKIRYQSDPRWWIQAEGGSNFNSSAGRSDTRFTGQIQFGFRLSLDRGVQSSVF